MAQGTGTQGRAKQSPNNKLSPDGKSQQEQSEPPKGILKQLGDTPAPQAALYGDLGDHGDNIPETRPSRR